MVLMFSWVCSPDYCGVLKLFYALNQGVSD
jgi:hypothetical protein